MKDHYATLGVARNAPAEVIRAAYRVLAQKYHPDRNPQPDAGRRAWELNAAYAVLKDSESRAAYDRELIASCGEGSANGNANSTPPGNETRSFQSPASPIRRAVGPVVYELLFEDGVVHEHTETIHHVQRIRNDLRPFIGVGKYIATEEVPEQRLWVRLARGDEMIQRIGELLPVADGQAVTLVSVHQPGSAKGAVPFVLINRASHRWFELQGRRKIAKQLLTARQSLMQGMRFLGAFSCALALLYVVVLRHVGLLGWTAGACLGIPLMGALIHGYTHKETQGILDDLREGLALAGLT